jgi:glutamate/tyrosine decarboxylase-like PLP-dependent enzyme
LTNKMQNHLDILSNAVSQWMNDDGPVATAPNAPELEQILDLKLGEKGCSIDELSNAIHGYLKYSPNATKPDFYKLLYSGLNKDALLGDWITSLVNSTMHTYQVGPVATLMELELIQQWNTLVGFDAGDGVMVTGGSQANLIGMMLARQKACPNIKTKGHGALNKQGALVAYVSDQSHYSYQRAANILGIGSDNLIAIKSDDRGRICPNTLAKAIEKDKLDGRTPFFIGLTAGTTVVGAYDPVKICSEIALKYGLWLHIDGAWGAPVLFSSTHKHLLSDCRLADSFTWDAHKLLNVPITAAVILVKESGALRDCCAGGGGEYLFHNDANKEFNLGERSIQCGRRSDALKVWLSWKAVGHSGFQAKIDYLQALKQRTVEVIEGEARFELLAPTVYLNILFRYKPENALDEEQIAQLNIRLCTRMRQQGGPYVDYARYKGTTGIRLILANDAATDNDIQRLLKHCLRVGQELEMAICSEPKE